VTYWAQKAWSYYGARQPLDGVSAVQSARIFDRHPERYADDARAKIAGAPRVWVVITHFSPSNVTDLPILEALAQAGAVDVPGEKTIEYEGAEARLVDASAIQP
jgi:hypothetical protein